MKMASNDTLHIGYIFLSNLDLAWFWAVFVFFDFSRFLGEIFGEGISETFFFDLAISKTIFKKYLLTVERDGKRFANSICFVKKGTCWSSEVAFSALSTGAACAKELKNAIV